MYTVIGSIQSSKVNVPGQLTNPTKKYGLDLKVNGFGVKNTIFGAKVRPVRSSVDPDCRNLYGPEAHL